MRYITIIGLILASALIGGLYGALYDQITYSISYEFFANVRFSPEDLQSGADRWAVARIGFERTWAIGLTLGTIMSLAGLLHQGQRKMIVFTLQAFCIALFTAFLFGMLAMATGGGTEDIAKDIVDKESFNKVLKMNNYSKVGGIIGMFLGLAWQVYKTVRSRKYATGHE